MRRINRHVTLIMIVILLMSLFTPSTLADTSLKKRSAEDKSPDINHNQVVDFEDILILIKDYHVKEGNSAFDEQKDINSDGIIDLYDLVKVAKRVGKKVEDENFNYLSLSKAIWKWSAKDIDDPLVLSNLKGWHINRVFLNVGIEHFEEQEVKNQHMLDTYPENYKSFIQRAKDEGIEVEALYGDSNWCLSNHLFKTLKDGEGDLRWYIAQQIQKVLDYNSDNIDKRFDAIHLDIEPHGIKDKDDGSGKFIWDTFTPEIQHQIMVTFLENLQTIRSQIDEHNSEHSDEIKLIIDWNAQMPFYDPYAKDIFSIVDEVSLMNYHPDTVVFKERAEIFLKVADRINKEQNKNLKISTGSEYQTNEECKTITLGKKTKEELDDYFEKSVESFKKYNTYNGLIIHDYKAYDTYMN